MNRLDIRRDQMAYVTRDGKTIIHVKKDLDDKEFKYRVFSQDIDKTSSPIQFLASNEFEDIRKYWITGHYGSLC